MNKEETNKFIHDHELFLLETRKKFGKTPLDDDIDEYLENKRYGYGKINSPNDKINHHYFNSKKLNRGNWMNPGVDMNMTNPVNNAKNILLGYQMMNNAMMTGGYPLLGGMNFFPIQNTILMNTPSLTQPPLSQSPLTPPLTQPQLYPSQISQPDSGICNQITPTAINMNISNLKESIGSSGTQFVYSSNLKDNFEKKDNKNEEFEHNELVNEETEEKVPNVNSGVDGGESPKIEYNNGIADNENEKKDEVLFKITQALKDKNINYKSSSNSITNKEGPKDPRVKAKN